MDNILLTILGAANGGIIGSGIVALLTLLDIVPRLAQLTKTNRYITTYETAIVLGATIGAFLAIHSEGFNSPIFIVIIVGFLVGVFIGMLASALAEVMNVIPVVIRRFRLEGYVQYILYSLLFGKVLGSLFQWIAF